MGGGRNAYLGHLRVGAMRVPLAVSLLALLAASALAGCANDPGAGADGVLSADSLPGFAALPLADLPTFSAPVLIDDVRAGGEPVIAITHSGAILVSAHPGFTHYHPSNEGGSPPEELLTPFAGQSYLWRSADNGTTWTHIGLPGREEGPRSLGLGVSDPEFTVMEDGTICYTDLEALAMSSVSCSTDDGLTWMPGNPVASGGATDRQWIASYKDEFYFTANYFADHHLRASTDRGLTWQDRGDVPCSQDLVANPANGHLIVACGAGIAVSTDGGWTWTDPSANRQELNRTVPGAPARGQRVMSEPGLDSAGNIWVTYTENETNLFAAGTPDEGVTWPWTIEITPHFRLYSTHDAGDSNGLNGYHNKADPTAATNGTYVWPWISAGSAGRIAVTWFGSYLEERSGVQSGPWYVFSASVVDANTAHPTVVVSRLTPNPMHAGPICQGGTGCQVTSVQGDPNGDRRLGDFFETTVGPDGYLYGAWSNTVEKPTDVISHPQFVRQTGGLRLISDAELGSFVPTQG
ncbi:MAG: hypothetical protein QOC71_315 [Thermoplasmata archaeon]|jgi:hypothetical protein|nr:hypothetical protein [Thermoplasmata archaeon]